MTKGQFPVDKFQALETPFYYYNMELLHLTLDKIRKETENQPYHIHYALKANANPVLLKKIAAYGFGADCVSGNEVLRAIEYGFPASKVVFAGVGKTDKEIIIGLDNDIYCFNVESLPEIEAIAELAAERNKVAQIALRINPNVDANTHKYITTGLEENKFGINESDLPAALDLINTHSSLKLIGMHFHIGSQIVDLSTFEDLSKKIVEIRDWFTAQGVSFEMINVGGGLGIDYDNPDDNPIAEFKGYFRLFEEHLKLQGSQTLHFELGRSVVGNCGSLISRIIYVKEGNAKKFIILDSGMTELLRPALYEAYHKIENLSSEDTPEVYDVVGPICESSDVFGEDVSLNHSKRGDIVAIRSAGAYGETMASTYNCRELPKSFFSDSL
mgnify:FL=1